MALLLSVLSAVFRSLLPALYEIKEASREAIDHAGDPVAARGFYRRERL